MENRFNILEENVRSKLKKQGFLASRIQVEYFLHMRYEGTDCALMVTPSGKISENSLKHGDFLTTFVERSIIFHFRLSL